MRADGDRNLIELMAAKPQPDIKRTANFRRTSAKDRRHQHLLDTGVRTSEADRQRNRRMFRLTAKLFIAAAVAAGVYIGGTKLVARVVMKNPQYNIAELSVETDGILDPTDVLEAANLHKGENIFRVDLATAQAKVAAIPQVEKVLIFRQLPNRLAIQINERKPVAWIVSPHAGPREAVVAAKQSWLIDANGILLRPKKLNPQDLYLPIIRNDTEVIPEEGQEANGEEIRAALDLLHAQQESSNNSRFQIREIDLSKHFGLVVTDQNGLQVLFDLNEMDRQLKRLEVYLQALDQHAQKPQTINLLVQRNVPVTFMVNAVSTDKPAATPAVAAPLPTPSATHDKGMAKEKTKSTAPPHHQPKSSGSVRHEGATTHQRQPFLAPGPNVRMAIPVDAGH